LKSFEEHVGFRDQTVDGIGPWYWLAYDTGAWDGPKTDWENSHKHKWLQHVKEWRIVVQAGGCQGMYPRLLSDHFQDVFSFEPDRLNFYVANLNCQKDNIHLFNGALGHNTGTWTGVMQRDPSNVGMHQTGGEGCCPIFTIDSFQFPYLGLLALDIEGYEIHALRGAYETIKRCNPVITTECPSGEVIHLLTELGYSAVDQSISDTVWVSNL
jgi:FkbM family methyltransferase